MNIRISPNQRLDVELSHLLGVPELRDFRSDEFDELATLMLHCTIANNPDQALEQMDFKGIIHERIDHEVGLAIQEGFAASVSSGALPNGRLLSFVIKRNPRAAYSALMKLLSIQFMKGVYDQMWAKLTRGWLNDSYALTVVPEEYPYLNRKLVHDKDKYLMWCNPFELKKVEIYTGDLYELFKDKVSPTKIVSEEKAMKNLTEVVGDGFPDNILIAGGLPSLCLSSNFDAFRNDTDVDIWINNEDQIKVIKKWAKQRGYDKYVANDTGINSFTGPNLPRVEIIYKKFDNEIEVVQEFDHSGCQSWVYSGRFYCTPDYALYAPHGIAIIHTTKLMLYRAIKACLRGWTLCITDGHVELAVAETVCSSFSKTSLPFTFDMKSDNTVVFDTALRFVYGKNKPTVVYTQDIDEYCVIDYTDYHRKPKFTKWIVNAKVYNDKTMEGFPAKGIVGYHTYTRETSSPKTVKTRDYKYIDLRGKSMPHEDIGSKTVNVGDGTHVFECVDCPLHSNVIEAWLH